MIDKDGTILFFNKEMAKISGVEDSKKIEGQNVFEVPGYKKYGLLQFMERGLAGKPFTIKGIQYVSHVGKKESFRDYYGIPIKTEAGDPDKLLCIVEDVTRRRELEAEVIENLEEKEAVLRTIRNKLDEDMNKINDVLASTKNFIQNKG